MCSPNTDNQRDGPLIDSIERNGEKLKRLKAAQRCSPEALPELDMVIRVERIRALSPTQSMAPAEALGTALTEPMDLRYRRGRTDRRHGKNP